MAGTICVLGSANMDLVAVVDRAPMLGETVTGNRFEQLPGGKGSNQALAAARAGGRVRMVGTVGADVFGEQIRSVLDGDGVDTRDLAVAAQPTGIAHIVVESGGANSIIVVPGANHAHQQLTDAHRAAMSDSSVLLLQLELPLPLVVEAARFARAAGVQVVLTPAPVVQLPDELLQAVDLLVPNEHEAAQLTGSSDPVQAADTLLRKGVGAVVVTLGDRGCVYASQDGASLAVPAMKVDAVDTTAAGDTFVGALAVALEEGRDVADALRWAAVAAGLSVQRFGASASMPRRDEIEAAAASWEA